jgi:hypothetical protein
MGMAHTTLMKVAAVDPSHTSPSMPEGKLGREKDRRILSQRMNGERFAFQT